MPLIGTKLHVLNAVWRKRKSREDSRNGQLEKDVPEFIVPETQEICKNAQELQRKNRLYAANIWTCRVTGKSNLTFRDAVKSEVTSHRILRKNFAKCFERVILEMVHLNKLPLEALVHSCWLGLHEQFHVAEPVKLRVESVSSTPIHGIINEVDKSSTPQQFPATASKALQSVVNSVDTAIISVSPNSSDKENTSSKKNSPVKKKNYSYTVKVLSDIPVVVHDVPACSIDRLNRAPVKDHIRMFIRAHAMRYGPNCSGPWIVDADMLRRYKLAPKCGGYEVDRVKLKQLSNEIEMEYFSRLAVAASRLYSPQTTTGADGPQSTEENETSQSTATATTPVRPFKRTKGFSVLREGGINKAKRESGRKSPVVVVVAEDELPLSALKQKAQASTGKGSSATALDESGKRKMKQVTLFQFGKKQADSNAPTDTPSSTTKHKPRTPSLPRAGQQLLKLFTEKPDDPLVAVQIKMCAKLFSEHDLPLLPTELRDRVSAQREAIVRRKKLSNMTPQQRKAYRMEQRKQQRAECLTAKRLIDDTELMLQQQQTPGGFHPDTALPDPTPLTLPDDLPQDLFGRLLGVAEFFHCFQTLLVDDSQGATTAGASVNAAAGDAEEVGGEAALQATAFPLSASESRVPCWGSSAGAWKPGDELAASTDDEEAEEEAALADMFAAPAKASVRAMRRLGVCHLVAAVSTRACEPASTYRCLARPLSLLLRLLLRDEELNRKRELGIRLSKLPVTPYTAPELLRLVLLHELKLSPRSLAATADTRLMVKVDDEEHASRVLKADGPEEEDGPAGSALGATPPAAADSELIDYLAGADMHRLPARIRLLALETAVERLFDLDLIDDHILVCQRRAAEFHSRKAKLIKDRKLYKKQQQQLAGGGSSSKGEKDTVNGREEEPGAGDVEGADQSLASEDLASIVKRRRLLAAQAANRREEKEMLERERRAAQAQEASRDRLLAAVSRTHDLYQSKARCALRCQPLGYDRHYRRIWYLRSAPDRLFVESNWACSDITYSVPAGEAALKTDSKDDTKTQTTEVESTVPLPAQRLSAGVQSSSAALNSSSWSSWAVYDCADQLDQLANALFSRGIRESRLKQQLVTDGVLEAIKARCQRKVEYKAEGGGDGTAVDQLMSSADTPAEHRAAEAGRSLTNPPARDADTALASVLLKHILDTEVRLRSGGLGGVPNFEAWQQQLAGLQDSLGLPTSSPGGTAGRQLPSRLAPSDRHGKAETSLTLLAQALIHVADHVMPRFLKVPDVVSCRTATMKRATASSSSLEPTHYPSEPSTGGGQLVVIKDEPGVPSKLIGNNAGRSVENSDSDSSDLSHSSVDIVLKDPESHELRISTWLSLWRSEVSKARTLARLSLLHACLDHCVRWEKSVEDARCRICRRKSDDDNLLLCDGCNLAFHLYCLRPPLRRVPSGDWFCVSCRPASRELERRRREARLLRSEQRRRQHALSEDSDSAEEAKRRNSSSDESEQEMREDSDASSSSSYAGGGCPRRSAQSGTVGGKHRLAGNVTAAAANRPQSAQRATAPMPVKHDSVCLICSSTSSTSEELVLCATCPNAFHLNCHNPPLHHVPRGGGWQCTNCRSGSRNTAGQLTRTRRRISYLRSCGPTSLGEVNHDDDGEEDSEAVATHTTTTVVRHQSRPSIKPTRSRPQRRPWSSSTNSSSSSASSSSSSASESESGMNGHRRGYQAVKTTTKGRKRRRVEFSSSASSSSSEARGVANIGSTATNQLDMCSRLLCMVIRNRNSWPFREPVDKHEVPDYYDIITTPVDLAMIQQWLSDGRYNGAAVAASADASDSSPPPASGLELLLQDLGQMFYNAELYNSADSDVWLAGSQLEHYVRQQVAQLKCGVRYSRPALGSL